jgi:hypothetical protein
MTTSDTPRFLDCRTLSLDPPLIETLLPETFCFERE